MHNNAVVYLCINIQYYVLYKNITHSGKRYNLSLHLFHFASVELLFLKRESVQLHS